MSNYKLTYFDIDGGRGEPVRIALHAAGIEFDDKRVSFPDFMEMREGLRFNAVPVMEFDDVTATQSNALCRYIGKLAGLYPEDALQALYCDEVLDVIEDLTCRIQPTLFLKGDEQRKAREELADGWMTVFLRGLGELLERGGGQYFADSRLTVADLKVLFQTRWLRSGTLDHVPADIVDRVAPNLVEHQARVEGDPVVKAYYASRA
jgi:glutathione S-transferase